MLECPERVLSIYCDSKQIIKTARSLSRKMLSMFRCNVKKRKGIDNLALLFGQAFVTTVLQPFILLREKFLQFDWLRAVVFQLNLKYLHVKITTLLWVVV